MSFLSLRREEGSSRAPSGRGLVGRCASPSITTLCRGRVAHLYCCRHRVRGRGVGVEDHRQRAFARNEALFRSLNEMLSDAATLEGDHGEVRFLCECSDEACADEILLRQETYEHVRAVATHFAVQPGHFRPDIERIVEQHGSYWVVAKTGDAADVARETDPRA